MIINKGLEILMLRILVTFFSLAILPISAASASEGNFELKRISPNLVAAGETVRWSLSFDGKSGHTLNEIRLYILGPNGERFTSLWGFRTNGLSKNANLKEELLSLQTGQRVSSGEYTVEGVAISTICGDCAGGLSEKTTRYIFQSEKKFFLPFGTSPEVRTVNLKEVNFQIEGGSFAKSAIPRIDSLSLSKSKISPGEKLRVTIRTLTPGNVWSWGIGLRSPSGRILSWGDNNLLGSWSASTSEYIRDGNQISITFEVSIDEDFEPGTYSISTLQLSWFLGEPPYSLSTRDTTDLWGGTYSIQNDSAGLRIVRNIWDSDYFKYEINKTSLEVIDPGQKSTERPIWTRIDWVKPEAKAGEYSYLEIDVDAFNNHIGGICVGIWTNENVVTRKRGEWDIYSCAAKLVGSNTTESGIVRVTKGTFQVRIYFPRNVTPGNYRIAYLSVISRNPNSNLNNSLRVTEYDNVLAGSLQPWSGYVDPGSKTLKLSGVGDVPQPDLDFFEITSESIKFYAHKPDEISCEYSYKASDISKLMNSIPGEILSLDNLKPFSDVKLDYLCKARDGSSSNGSFTVKTKKPPPPAPPVLSLKEARSDGLTLTFTPREGFTYEATSSHGVLRIDNGTIEISLLQPDKETLITTTVTDTYNQSSTSIPQLFRTVLPSPPREPVLTLLGATNKKLTFSFTKETGIAYEFNPSRGTASVAGNILTITKFNGTAPIQVTAKALSRFGQLTTHKTKMIKIPKK